MRVNVSHRQCLMNMATFSCENPCSVGFSTCLWAGIGMQHVFFARRIVALKNTTATQEQNNALEADFSG